jgi:hypothetical protein
MQHSNHGETLANSHGDRVALEGLVVEDPDLERLEGLLDQFNVFEAIGAVRQEVRHSDFLAFLLNPRQPHGLGDAFLKRVLQRALRVAEQGVVPLTPIDLDMWSLDETLVLREWQDIDVLVLDEAHKLAVLIENKIGTHEHTNQLDRYYSTVQTHYPSWRIAALYLTPDGESASDPRYLPIDYGLICGVLEQLAQSRASTLGRDVLTTITHYTRMLRRHIVGDSEIAELCRRIYLKHQRALDLIYEYRPDRQAELLDEIERLIGDESTLVADYSSKSYIRFAPRVWDESAALRAGSGWTRSGRILLFEFSYLGSTLRLKLLIGPGPQQTRQLLFTMAHAHRPPFTVTDKTLYQKWNTVYDRPMVRAALSRDADRNDVQDQLRTSWADFLAGDMQAIMAVVKTQPEFWQA